jgi:hypothetical protein
MKIGRYKFLDERAEEATMSTPSTEEMASKEIAQAIQQPATGAVSSVRKNPPGQACSRVPTTLLIIWLIDLSACYKGIHVTVEIGPEKKAYVMHKDLLTFYSDYFRAALNGSFEEATEGKISLPDEREDLFDIFNQFIYSRVIADEKGHELNWDVLVGLWLFGDKYIIPSLQNSAMDAIMKRACVRNTTPTSQVNNIWEHTTPSSPLRKYILERVIYKLRVDDFLAKEHWWTRDALLDLVVAYANKEIVNSSEAPLRGKCYFHVHKNGEEC